MVRPHVFLLLVVAMNAAFAQTKDVKVAIAEDLPYVEVNHRGVPVTIKRIQDTQHRLTDDFSKTSRVCPPFCIQPMQVAKGVRTIGELELLQLMQSEIAQGKALLIDARMPDWHASETIPTAINVPFVMFEGDNKDVVLGLFGASQTGADYDFSNAYTLVLFCNGPWCDQSPRAAEKLIELGYPKDKLIYYRGGMQAWRSFGLTTVVPKPNEVK